MQPLNVRPKNTGLDNKPIQKKENNLELISSTQEQKETVMDDEKLKLAFMQSIKELPKERVPGLLEMIENFTENAKHEPIKTLPTSKDELKTIGIELYPDFKKRTGEANGLKCLEENYYPWLKKYSKNLDRDYMSQANLKKLDPKLLTRLKDTMELGELNKILPSLPMLKKQIAQPSFQS